MVQGCHPGGDLFDVEEFTVWRSKQRFDIIVKHNYDSYCVVGDAILLLPANNLLLLRKLTARLVSENQEIYMNLYRIVYIYWSFCISNRFYSDIHYSSSPNMMENCRAWESAFSFFLKCSAMCTFKKCSVYTSCNLNTPFNLNQNASFNTFSFRFLWLPTVSTYFRSALLNHQSYNSINRWKEPLQKRWACTLLPISFDPCCIFFYKSSIDRSHMFFRVIYEPTCCAFDAFSLIQRLKISWLDKTNVYKFSLDTGDRTLRRSHQVAFSKPSLASPKILNFQDLKLPGP